MWSYFGEILRNAFYGWELSPTVGLEEQTLFIDFGCATEPYENNRMITSGASWAISSPWGLIPLDLLHLLSLFQRYEPTLEKYWKSKVCSAHDSISHGIIFCCWGFQILLNLRARKHSTTRGRFLNTRALKEHERVNLEEFFGQTWAEVNNTLNTPALILQREKESRARYLRLRQRLTSEGPWCINSLERAPTH